MEVIIFPHRPKSDTISKPVITSLASAQQQINEWLRESNYQTIVDSEGLPWALQVKSIELPNTESLAGGRLQISFLLHTITNSDLFIASGILDREQDKRLIELMEDKNIELVMRPIVRDARSTEETRTLIAEEIIAIKKRMKHGSLIAIKRRLISKWVDQHMLFGAKNSNDFNGF